MTEQMQPPPLMFDIDIQPLFRASDRAAMEFMFDLWDYADVKENAEDILAQTESGEMPCDEAWPEEQVELFRRWIAEGCQP
jgi:hypothetical protein